MAPILATATGITCQVYDETELQQLKEKLSSIGPFPKTIVDPPEAPSDELMSLLRAWSDWKFEEEVDLYEWIQPLNAIDNALRYILHNNAKLLIVPPVDRRSADTKAKATSVDTETTTTTTTTAISESPTDCDSVSVDTTRDVVCILRFLYDLLMNSYSKALFNTIDEVVDLLGSYDDNVAYHALRVLQAVAVLPAIHKQQAPEVIQQQTRLHDAKPSVYSRIGALARGWSTQVMGFGLYTAVTADDSIHGQGQLPSEAGIVSYSFYSDSDDNSKLHEVHLDAADILVEKNDGVSPENDEVGHKRRRVNTRGETKPTSHLFFLALQKLGGRDEVSAIRQFLLLADIRLAKGFYSQNERIKSVDTRLRALVTMLYVQPNEEVLSGYFQAQPELCVEVVDLLKPIVSTANVSSASNDYYQESVLRQDAIEGLASSSVIPFSIKMLALDVFTALVIRRDSTASTLAGSTRLSNVLVELGVSKGQYLGLLPTLIRYCLASLGTSKLNSTEVVVDETESDGDSVELSALDIGLAFAEAVMPPREPRTTQVKRALDFVSNVLNLTSAIVSSPNGTSALTDCGLIPALLNTIALDHTSTVTRLVPDHDQDDLACIHQMLRYVGAQAIQILEKAIVLHGTALSTFHDLKGVDILSSKLANEVSLQSSIQSQSDTTMDVSDNVPMSLNNTRNMSASIRVQLISIVTCLTVVFHQESTSSSSATSAPSGGQYLKKEELTRVIIDMLENSSVYGGHLLSLIATLLSNVMNGDPHIVHDIHSSGIAASFLKMVGESDLHENDTIHTSMSIPPVSELIVAIPNVIAALALTEDGAQAVYKSNPFPRFLRVFYHPDYAMPSSRCLLVEISAVIGTTLDEIMRHVPLLKPLVISAIIDGMKNVIRYANDLKVRESIAIEKADESGVMYEDERTCLIQYVVNFSQILEQALPNEDHCETFVESGGVKLLLEMFSASLPTGKRLLSQLSCMSSPSVSTLHHSTIETCLALAFHNIELKKYSPRILNDVASELSLLLDKVDESKKSLYPGDGDTSSSSSSSFYECLPQRRLYELRDGENSESDMAMMKNISDFVRNIISVQWMTGIFSVCIKSGRQSNEMDSGWPRIDTEWEKYFTSTSFNDMFSRLFEFYQKTMYDVCEARSNPEYDSRDIARYTNPSRVLYRLRIVCPEGAVVRDGIEIDSCESIGNIEMGEMIIADDRCINSSGVLRYKTNRGWVSEMTRGHGREPIAEVTAVWKIDTTDNNMTDAAAKTSNECSYNNRLEADIPDLQFVTIGVLARSPRNFSDLLSNLSKVAVQNARAMSSRPGSRDKAASVVSSLTKLVATSFLNCFDSFELDVGATALRKDDSAVSLFLGCMLQYLQLCIFEEWREKKLINLPLLLYVVSRDESKSATLHITDNENDGRSYGFIRVVNFILDRILLTMDGFRDTRKDVRQVLPRWVAVVLPTLINLLQRLVATQLSASPLASVMSRVKWGDMPKHIGLNQTSIAFAGSVKPDTFFQPEIFNCGLLSVLSESLHRFWLDSRISLLPAHVLHPIILLINDILPSLDTATKKRIIRPHQALRTAGNTLLSDLIRERTRQAESESNDDGNNSIVGASSDVTNEVDTASSNRLESLLLAGTDETVLTETRNTNDSGTTNRTAANATAAAVDTSSTSVNGGGKKDSKTDIDGGNEFCLGTEERTKKDLTQWLDSMPEACANLLCNLPFDNVEPKKKAEGNANMEASTIVVSSFLIEYYHKYPEHAEKAVESLLDRLQKCQSGSLDASNNRQLSCLYHAAALTMRALPNMRTLVLKRDILKKLVAGLQSTVNSMSEDTEITVWLTPALLLLEVLLRPFKVFDKNELLSKSDEAGDSDYVVVKREHIEQGRLLAQLSRVLGSVVMSTTVESKGDEGDITDTVVPNLAPFPSAYIESCLDVCFLLVKHTAHHSIPGVVQAVLMLLCRLLQNPTISTKCLQKGLAETILEIPKTCKFDGNSGLVALLLRKLMQDEATLASDMERGIRAKVLELYTKEVGPNNVNNNSSNNKDNSNDTPSAALAVFMDAVTPLMHREARVCCQVLASTVKITIKDGDKRVYLLEPTEKKDTLHLFSQFSETTKPSSLLSPEKDKVTDVKRRHNPSSENTKDKSNGKNKRQVLARRQKRDKSDGTKTASPAITSVSAPVHVASLLVSKIVSFDVKEITEKTNEDYFLWISDLLNILADLVLAVPACASAIHNCTKKDRLSKISVHVQNALEGAPAPSRTFVNHLLHTILPQDRWTIQKYTNMWGKKRVHNIKEDDVTKFRKIQARSVVSILHACARVLVALVARPGEGRRRVIVDLVYALSAGQSKTSKSTKDVHNTATATSEKKNELHAIYAWAELCMGLVAPTSSGKVFDGTSALSIEVAKLMLEHNAPQALLKSLSRVKLHHPMASTVCSSLLFPLEVLTRTSVNDAAENLVNKESSTDDKNGKKTNNRGALGPILEAYRLDQEDGMSFEEQIEHNGNDVHADQHDHDDDEENDYMEGFNVAGRSSSESSVESSSSESSLMSGEEENSVLMSSEDDDEDDDNEEDEESETMEDEEEIGIVDSYDDETSTSSEEVDEEGEWNVSYGVPFHPEIRDSVADVDDANDGEDDMDRADQLFDDGWTRVENPTFDGLVVNNPNRRNIASTMNAEETSRTRSFMDAAEQMIGSLLRTGEISADALAEIETTLGIRLGADRGALRSFSAATFSARLAGVSSQGATDTGLRNTTTRPLFRIRQVNRPDPTHITYGNNSLWVESSGMESIYGGPSVTARNVNYDLVTTNRRLGEENETPSFAYSDLHLFPVGASTLVRTCVQSADHPLVRDIDLPPVNALVSSLRPHGSQVTTSGGALARENAGSWINSASSDIMLLPGQNQRFRPFFGTAMGTDLPNTENNGPSNWVQDIDTTDGGSIDGFRTVFENLIESRASNLRTAGDDAGNAAGTATATATATDALTERDGENVENNTENVTESAIEEVSIPQAREINNNNDDDDGTESVHDMSIVDEGTAASLAVDVAASDQVADSGETGLPSLTSAQAATMSSHDNNGLTSTNVNEDAQGSSDIAAPSNDGNVGAIGESSNVEGPNDDANDTDRVVTSHSRDEDGDEEIAARDESVLICPPTIDAEVFHSLPRDMQQDCIDQYNTTQDIAAQIDGSSLDPEVLAALPEDMRREVIEQDRLQRMSQERHEAPANPELAQEMDNASFVASLSPGLREEILSTADESFLSSLPPDIAAEARLLRERANVNQRSVYETGLSNNTGGLYTLPSSTGIATGSVRPEIRGTTTATTDNASASRRKSRTGKIRVEKDRKTLLPLSTNETCAVTSNDLRVLIRMLYLLTPVRPTRLLHKLLQNLCMNPALRKTLSTAFILLLHEDLGAVANIVNKFDLLYNGATVNGDEMDVEKAEDSFPPTSLLGSVSDSIGGETGNNHAIPSMYRRAQGMSLSESFATSLPRSQEYSKNKRYTPSIVISRVLETYYQICKHSPRFGIHNLTEVVSTDGQSKPTDEICFSKLLDLLGNDVFRRSSTNLDQLLSLLEVIVSPLSNVSSTGESDVKLTQREIDSAESVAKEWIDIPRIDVSKVQLQLLCSILRADMCKDSAFTKVNTIIRRLCRVDTNRGIVMTELASVACALGVDAIKDLRALRVRMEKALDDKEHQAVSSADAKDSSKNDTSSGLSTYITLSTSTSEIKLLRVLQTLQALNSEDGGGSDDDAKTTDRDIATNNDLYVPLYTRFDDLWQELTTCLKLVHILEGVGSDDTDIDKNSEDDANMESSGIDEAVNGKRKLKNSAAGLLTRFLPSIEAFLVASTSALKTKQGSVDGSNTNVSSSLLNEEKRLYDFVSTNRVLLNALVRSNANLLDKGFRALVQVPRCRSLLDFDVKRQWFKTQVRRLRQQASRRHGSLRLTIRRKYVFEDAYHQLSLRNADEIRGRLHITFRDEEGVDAGGLSREFFGILAKEMFDPNYALFTSTEDGCTFQPNPNSSINPDHLSYFRFVGRIVGKAVADGYLLDAHFTRSLYKHMLGLKPSHEDMEAIDPDYYRNLKTILEYSLADIGLDLTFSIEEPTFGRNQTIDLMPNGRNVQVTDSNKEQYVQLVCQYRMTTAIQNQIKAYLDGFYELVSPDLVAVFTPRELELLISGLPDIDTFDLKRNTDYVGWKSSDKEIEWFWNILASLSRSEKASFLQFVTGSSKVPLAGFAELQGMRGIQKFSIHKANGAKGMLMSAHTCFNSLDLPVYKTEEEMREKFLYAIKEGSGAFLFA